MDLREAYTTLELPYGSPLEGIEAAFNKLVRVWHPDRFAHAPDLREDASRKLAQLTQAREVLREAWRNNGVAVPPLEPADYSDLQVKYLGGDPRLPAPAVWSRSPVAVRVSAEGLTIGIVVNGQLQQAQDYAAASIERLCSSSADWTREGRVAPSLAHSSEVVLMCRDPAGIVTAFNVRVRFRNEYFTKLFAKSAAGIIGFPDTKRQQKAQDVIHESMPTDTPDGWKELSLALGGAVILIVILFVFVSASG